MIQPIGSSTPAPLPSSTNVPALSQQMQTQTATLADQLQKVTEDPSLSEDPSFLERLAKNTDQLNKTVEQANLIR